jgi:hypothetical protein
MILKALIPPACSESFEGSILPVRRTVWVLDKHGPLLREARHGSGH